MQKHQRLTYLTHRNHVNPSNLFECVCACAHTQQLVNGQLPISAGLQSRLFAHGLRRLYAVNWSHTQTVYLMRYNNHIKKQKDEIGIKHSAKFLTSPDATEANHRCLQKLLDFSNNSATFALGTFHRPAKPPHDLWFILRGGFTDGAWWGLFRSPEVSLLSVTPSLSALPVFRPFCTFNIERICPVANHTLLLVLLASRVD